MKFSSKFVLEVTQCHSRTNVEIDLIFAKYCFLICFAIERDLHIRVTLSTRAVLVKHLFLKKSFKIFFSIKTSNHLNAANVLFPFSFLIKRTHKNRLLNEIILHYLEIFEKKKISNHNAYDNLLYCIFIFFFWINISSAFTKYLLLTMSIPHELTHVSMVI